MKDFYYPIIIFLLSAVAISCHADSTDRSEYFYVKEVVDGDTVVLGDLKETRLRYIGINSPENLTDDSPGDPFAYETTKMNKNLVGGKRIRVEYDEQKYDDYGRLLGYVYADNLLVNEQLLNHGLAKILFIKPNLKYFESFKQAEKYAQDKRIGIWTNPVTYRYPLENNEFLVKSNNVYRYTGQRIVTRGKISDHKTNSKVLRLIVEDDFEVVIFKNNLPNFHFFNIKPTDYYLGKPVEVIGRVSKYRGRTQIKVLHPFSIRLLN